MITVAGSSAKVAGLVYVAGVAPDEGESVTTEPACPRMTAVKPLAAPGLSGLFVAGYAPVEVVV